MYLFGEHPTVEYPYCARYSWLGKNVTKNCKVRDVKQINICDPEQFKKFKAAGFVIIHESEIDPLLKGAI